MATQAGLNNRSGPNPGTLKRLPYSEQSRYAMNINIVIIPEMRTAKGNAPSWPKTLVQPMDPKAQLLWFDYFVDLHTNPSIWLSLIDQGDNLVDSIEQNMEKFQLTERRIIFICHGFGGLVLKSALARIHRYSSQTTRPLLEAESGIIFLGTPHPTYEQRNRWDEIILPLHLLPNLSKQSIAQAELEGAIPAGISSKFQESGIQVPVLSIYETKKSWIGNWLSGKRKKIVDENMAKTSLKEETLVPVNLEHDNLVSIQPKSDAYRLIQDLIKNTIDQPLIPAAPNIASNQEPIGRDEEFEWTSQISQFESSDRRQGGSKPSGVGLSSADAASIVMIPQVSELVAPRKEPKLPCYVPPSQKVDPLFFGRRGVLSDIDEALLPPLPHVSIPPGVSCYTLCGLGGVGKTQVAAEYLSTRKEHYDAVFWVEADEESKLAETFGSIAVHLGLEEGSETLDHAVSRNVVLEWLTNPIKPSGQLINGEKIPASQKANWLLVFDNADHPEFLSDYWPTGTSNGAILMTTRKPLDRMNFELTVAGCKSVKRTGVDLDGFSSTEAVKFLQKATGFQATDPRLKNSNALTERLKGLPLAMGQIVPFVKESSVDRVLQSFEERSADIVKRMGQTSLSTQDGNYRHTILTVWAFENLHEHAMRLLEVISFMDPSKIPEDLLILAHEVSTNGAAGYPQTKRQHEIARDELIESSLIKYNPQLSIITIHRLVQDVVQAQIPSSRARTTFELLVDLLSHSWPWVPDQFAHDTTFHLWERYMAILPHVRMLAHFYRSNPEWKLSGNALRNFAKLLQASSWYYVESGNHESAQGLIQLASAISRDHLDEMRDILADALFCMCVMGYKTNMPPEELFRYAEEHLTHREILNDGNEDEIAKTMLGTAHSTLGMAHMLLGNLEKAVDHCDASRHIEKSTIEVISGKAHPHFANIFGAYALAALGRHDEALSHLNDTLEFRKRLYGEEDSSYKLGCVIQVKADILMKQSHFDESYELHIKAWEIYKKAVGPNYWGSAQVCVKLGEHFTRRRAAATAKALFDQALKIFQTHSCYAPEIARVKFKIAKSYEAFQESEEAEKFMKQATDEYKRLAPEWNGDELSEQDFDELVVIFSR